MTSPGAGSSGSPTVSVLIPTYKDADLLRKSVPVFLAHTPDEVEILYMNYDHTHDVAAALEGLGDDDRVRLEEM